MPYMLLILETRDRRKWPPEQARRAWEDMVRFREDLTARGVFRASAPLRPDAEGVRVEVRSGRRIVVDGPFAESKEIVGGYFLLDDVTREQAIAIAGECPATEWATVEVREVAATCVPDGV